MEPMQSMAYYIELQRQVAPAQEAPANKGVTPLDEDDRSSNGLDKLSFNWPDSLPVARIQAGLVELALVFLLLAAVGTFCLACVLSPTFLK